MDRSQKEELVQSVKGMLSQSSTILVVKQTGLTVDQVTNLRRQMRGAGAQFKVLKNTLARIAVQGTSVEKLQPLLNGPTVIAFSNDPVSVAKVLVKFSDTNDRLEVLGGMMDGRLLDQSAVKTLATLPSLDELRSKILAVINTPATRIAVVTKEPAASLARVMAAYGRSGN